MTSIRRIGIVAKIGLTEAAPLLGQLAGWLTARGVAPVFETATAELTEDPRVYPCCSREALPAAVDLVLVLGGDGTLLGMASRIAAAEVDVPIIGVNFDSLGFLTEVTLAEMHASLEAVLAGRAQVEHRLMLRCQTWRGGDTTSNQVVLNDVVVTRGAASRIIDLSVTVDDEFVARFKADGLILATPTGSTAYNLAAGGPIVHPAMDAVILTPIAPHTLTNRPVVISAAAEVRVQPLPETSPQEIFVAFDGAGGRPLGPDDVLVVRKAERRLRLIRATSRSYFDVLRTKLKWAER